jgi:hypothetical protein
MAKDTIFTCKFATVTAYCRKRSMMCPYYGSRACDDYAEGRPRIVWKELVGMGDKEKIEDSEPDETK